MITSNDLCFPFSPQPGRRASRPDVPLRPGEPRPGQRLHQGPRSHAGPNHLVEVAMSPMLYIAFCPFTGEARPEGADDLVHRQHRGHPGPLDGLQPRHHLRDPPPRRYRRIQG